MMSHIPVLLREVINFFNPEPGQDFIDCTIGSAGHARRILEGTAPDGRLLGIDLSEAAIERLSKELVTYGDRVILVRDSFRNIKDIAYAHAMDKSHGILLDLGLSSEELSSPELGLSFQVMGPLDMRLSGEGKTAADLINSVSERELISLIRKYGEERFASQIAKAIVQARRKDRILTTTALVGLILEAVPSDYEGGRIHPATRTFQALRIAVNDELGALEAALPQAVELLESGGRLAVISFHSLEDRIVKRFFREESRQGRLRILTKRPVQAGEEEVAKNPRARSAKLRVAEKI